MSAAKATPAASSFGEIEELFEHLVNKSPMGIFLYALEEDGRLIFRASNETASRLLKTDCQAFIGKTIGEAFPSLKQTEIPDVYRRLATEGGSWESEDVEYKDERITGAFSVNAFQTVPGRVAVMFEDITERKRAEHQIAAARAALLAAIEATPAGVIIADAPDVRIRLINSSALEIRGVSRERLEGLRLDQHVKDWPMLRLDGSPYSPNKLPLSRAVINGETVQNEELLLTTTNGEARHVIANAAPILDAKDHITGGVLVFLDITDRIKSELEQKRLQRQMQRAQKLESLGILAGGIAHDFNNLLCVILGGTDLSLCQLPDRHAAREGIEMARETAQRATDLCRQMLAYSGKGRFSIKVLDLKTILLGMEDLLKVSVAKKIALHLELPEGLAAIEGDEAQISQVIINMVVNASEAIGDQAGVVTVKAGQMDCDNAYLRRTYLSEQLPAGPYVYLEISDTGQGIDSSAKGRLFDPFFTTKQTGRGLGLAAVLGIVRAHDGTIEVNSEKGVGSTFRILFPASNKSVAIPAAVAATDELKGEGTVLLVDDERVVLRVGQLILEKLGFDVVPATNGLEAVHAYADRRDEIALVILDMTMPVMNGEEAFKELRRIDPELKIILTSGYDSEDTTSRFSGMGLTGFMQKPFQIADMRAAISAALAK